MQIQTGFHFLCFFLFYFCKTFVLISHHHTAKNTLVCMCVIIIYMYKYMEFNKQSFLNASFVCIGCTCMMITSLPCLECDRLSRRSRCHHNVIYLWATANVWVFTKLTILHFRILQDTLIWKIIGPYTAQCRWRF